MSVIFPQKQCHNLEDLIFSNKALMQLRARTLQRKPKVQRKRKEQREAAQVLIRVEQFMLTSISIRRYIVWRIL